MTATITRPAAGTRFTVDTVGTAWCVPDWTVTSVRNGRVYGTPTPVYDRGEHKAMDSWSLAEWATAYGQPTATQPLPAVTAADASRDEVTVPVGDDDEGDVHLCGLFGHEFEDGIRCAVCGEPDPANVPDVEAVLPLADAGGMEIAPAPRPDPAVAAVLTDAAAHPVTITGEPGGFGAALGMFGFGEGTRGESMSEGVYWAFDHATAAVRVVCYTDDGNRVALIGFDPERRAARLVAWKATFDGSTPQHAVLTALAAALGILPVAR